MLDLSMIYSEEVQSAKDEGKALVALESTIITHGMPYPQNLETATEVENIIRRLGAVPATIAILEGKIHIGLEPEALAQLAESKGQSIRKVSTRDIAAAIVQKVSGATTVAATMRLAHAAGISVFVTGGIGGVHRGAQETFDISADLIELAQTPVAVVCAGAKSILDLGLTLEYLETYAVPVLGYQTSVFPAFYVASSSFSLENRVESPAMLAELIKRHWCLSKSGIVVANPIPMTDSLDASAIETIIVEALAEAARRHIHGKAVTPFLLSDIQRRTGGQSLQANVALIQNNARLGAELALSLQERRL